MLVAVPVVIFVLPDVFFGHLLLTGDNLQQNYPLRVLVGSMYRHGQLPFWNSYIFSGTPLLAGFNAGAFYPLIGLFVVLALAICGGSWVIKWALAPVKNITLRAEEITLHHLHKRLPVVFLLRQEK